MVYLPASSTLNAKEQEEAARNAAQYQNLFANGEIKGDSEIAKRASRLRRWVVNGVPGPVRVRAHRPRAE